MRIISAICLVILTACPAISQNGQHAAEVVNITFYDSTERANRTTTIADDLKSHYGYDFSGLRILLIETPSSVNADYLLLNQRLEELKHGAFEEHQVILVVACIQAAIHSGYHTTVETALKMSEGKPRFRVRLLNSSGAVLRESMKPLSAVQLQQWFNK